MPPDLDLDAALALNNAHEAETSRLGADELAAMAAGAFHVGLVAGGRDAMLIAFDQDAAYDSPNFLWFRDRFPRFVYVDRVIVSPARRGEGIARALYGDLFAAAAAAGHAVVACEVNTDPPNPGSLVFHLRMGFVEAGRGEAKGKAVVYMTRSLAP